MFNISSLPAPFGRLLPRDARDIELDQSRSRFLYLSTVAIYFLIYHLIYGWANEATLYFIVMGCYGLIAAANRIDLSRRPQRRIGRLVCMITADNIVIFIGMASAGAYASVLLGLAFWTIIANGYRYGHRFLQYTQILVIVGFLLICQINPFWRNLHGITFPIMSALIMVPLYVSKLMLRLNEAIGQAEEASKAKTRFVANMSHEIRTPIQGILGLSALLTLNATDQKQREIADHLNDSANALLSIVNDVLDFSRIESGNIRIVHAPYNLHDLLRRSARLFSHQAALKGLSIHCDIAEDVPKAVRGDQDHLQQALINLIGNAVKFTKEGAITIRCRISKKNDAGRKEFAIEIADTGPGIRPEFLPHIFDRFAQDDTDVKRQGTGLGTTITKQLVESMTGSITVESTLGQGTTFHLRLPLDAVDENVLAATDSPSLFDAVMQSRAKQPLSILLAEDNFTACMVTESLLTHAGHNVTIARDGAEAFTLLASQTFDAAILDLQMPKLTGIEVMTRSRELNRTGMPSLYILMSADASSETIARAHEAGFDACLPKPVEAARLLAQLASVKPAATKANSPTAHANSNISAETALRQRILNAFANDTSTLLGQMRSSIEKKDVTTLREAMHALRGCALAMGATDMADDVRALEHAADVDILELTQGAMPRLSQYRDEILDGHVLVKH